MFLRGPGRGAAAISRLFYRWVTEDRPCSRITLSDAQLSNQAWKTFATDGVTRVVTEAESSSSAAASPSASERLLVLNEITRTLPAGS
jgi:hypothetical protein